MPLCGAVFGTDTPGDRQHDWDETGSDANRMKAIRNVWPDLSAGSLVVSRSSELDGVLGTAVDIVKDAVEFLIDKMKDSVTNKDFFDAMNH